MKLVCITDKGDNDLYRYAVTKNRVYDIIEEGMPQPTGFVKILDDHNDLNWFPKQLFKTLVECRKDKINRIYETGLYN